MAYTVLARRYRSGTFDEVVGQGHVAQTLKRAIEADRVAHAYLFCGTRGTGKTSMARILAKALNCQGADKPTTTPCNRCDSCTAIARGEDIDVIEIDAASQTSVENVREIIANAGFRPARSRFKVYIIDEVHMLSKSAFNALLKTLEEPPSHVKFILATTEPEKILPTILSRCQRYDFRNIPTREIAAHLRNVCSSEGVEADEDALLLIARAGAGSMRDSLSLLDRLISVGEKTLKADAVEQLLGLPKSQAMFDLAAAIASGSPRDALELLEKLLVTGQAAETLVGSLIDHFRGLLLVNACGVESQLVEIPGIAPADLAQQAKQFDLAGLAQNIALLEELRRQLRLSVAARALLDATIVRLALAEQFANVDDLLARLDGEAAPADQKKKSEPLTAAATTTTARLASAPPPVRPPAAPPPPSHTTPAADTTPATSPSPTTAADDEDDELPAVGKIWKDEGGPSLTEMLRRQEALAAQRAGDGDRNVEPIDQQSPAAIWQATLVQLAAQSPGLHPIVAPARLDRIDGDVVTLRFPHEQSASVQLLDRGNRRELVAAALARLLDRAVQLRTEVDPAPPAGSAPPPPAAPARAGPPRREPARPDADAPPEPTREVRMTPELKAAAEADPVVQAAISELGAMVVRVE